MNQGTHDIFADCSQQIRLINTFRKLWEQHVMWTRSFIISTTANLGDLPFVTKRLMRNPQDFAKKIQLFYGDEKAKKFAALLTEHLSIAGQLVNHAKAGNKRAADEDRRRWYHNADEISEYLSTLNPYWSKQEWQNMLYDHLKMTESEATHRLMSQYAADVALYDDIERQALRMADYMSEGLRKQFQI